MQRIISIFTGLILCGTIGSAFAQAEPRPAMFNIQVINNTGVYLHKYKVEDQFGYWCKYGLRANPPYSLSLGPSKFSYCTHTGSPGTIWGVITYSGSGTSGDFGCLFQTNCNYTWDSKTNSYYCYNLYGDSYSWGPITCTPSVDSPSDKNNWVGTVTYTIAPKTGGKQK